MENNDDKGKKTKDKTLKGRNEVDFKWLILTHEGCFR